MSSQTPAISKRRHTHRGHLDRSHLRRKKTSPNLLVSVFLVALLLTTGLSVFLAPPSTAIEQGIVTVVALLCLSVGIILALRAKAKPLRLRLVARFFAMGALSGMLAASAGVGSRYLPDDSPQTSHVNLLEKSSNGGSIPKGEIGEEPGDDPLPSDGEDSPSSGVVFNEEADRPKNGSNIRNEDEEPQRSEQEFTPPSRISAALPIVLEAGTRLQLLPSERDEIRLRLEENNDKFVTGLSKTDFRILSKDGVELDYDIVEMPEQTIAVRSNISMIVDESLTLQTQQGGCVPAIETVLQASAYSGYKLSTAGASIRTLVDWTSTGEIIESATTRFRQSYDGSLKASVSLNVADLSKQPSKRILLLFLNSRSLQIPLSTDMQTRFARADITTLVVTDDSRTAKRLAQKQTSVQFFSFSQLDELQQVVRKLTTRVEPPSYLISDIESHHGSALRLVVGSGDSAVTASLGPSAGLVSVD